MKRRLLKISGNFFIILGFTLVLINFLIEESSFNEIFGELLNFLLPMLLIGLGYYLVELSKNSKDKKSEKDMDDFWDSTSPL